MNAAGEFELLKARRAGVFRWGALVLLIGVPGLATAFFELARTGGGSPAATKASAMIADFSLAGLIGTAGQLLSVSMLLSAGVATSWSFGREFVDDAVPALFAIATPRTSVVAAKFVVLFGWAVASTLGTVGGTVLVGALLGLPVDRSGLARAAQAVAVGVLSGLLATPLALISSWRRGYLAGFVALLGVVVATQVVTATGAGGWFPYAAPSLWIGLGGPSAAAAVTTIQLLLPIVVAAAAVAATVAWWRHAQVV